MIRLRLEPGLTNREARALEARAAEEMRGIGNYVAWLITRDLARKPRRRRTGAKLSDKREPYGVAVPLSTGDRTAPEERADFEMRSLSNYVATLILEELG